MEVILIKDVENLGAAHTLVSVKAGYGRNYLIPQGFAIIANTANKNTLNSKLRALEAREARMTEDLKAIADKITKKPLTISTKAGTSGKIFGSISSITIAQAIKEAYDIEIERRKITFAEEVKFVGSYVANIALSKFVQCQVPFNVLNEDAPAEVVAPVAETAAPVAETTEESTEA
jgi:large subunit ribosomal protein L9